MRKYKGRTVFQGNNVKDEAADVALFAELGSFPANMEGKALDAYGAMPGNTTTQGDGKQAYTHALTQGILTWTRLPRNRWPKEWVGVYKDPVVLLILALYGHPDSGDYGNVIVRKPSTQMSFILSIPNVGRQCFGIHVLDFYLDFLLMISRWQDLQKTLTRGGNSSPHKSIWTHLRAPDVALVVNMFSTTMPNWTKLITHLPMSLTPVFLTPLVSQPVRPARRTRDYWEHMPELGVHVHHHLQPRKKFQDKPRASDSFRVGKCVRALSIKR